MSPRLATVILVGASFAAAACNKKKNDDKAPPAKPTSSAAATAVHSTAASSAPAPAPTAAAPAGCNYTHKDPDFCLALPDGYTAGPPSGSVVVFRGATNEAFNVEWMAAPEDMVKHDSRLLEGVDAKDIKQKSVDILGGKGQVTEWTAGTNQALVVTIDLGAPKDPSQGKEQLVECRWTNAPANAEWAKIEAACKSMKPL
jgi:hypothetical protein